ncbi:LarC family nickel insertion protein [Methanoculleus sp. FWC-SCC3]|uniref:LarC family nickel insertion protein n=1 Tax=Methanoculleus methanifontis TaxID=2584086 RepID=A0ABT8M036_9EURY|nr:LarC family nickel insertion protein [Methanoculleus sp. FWC-SCC3]MDN7011731.1 LarC family nickel insertion protein [Methanoculleus sp. FWC-SCC3]
MRVLVIDPACAGIAGDMLLASLIDLTGESRALDPLADAIRHLDLCREFTYEAKAVDAGGIAATRLVIEIEEERASDLLEAAAAAAGAAGLTDAARSRAIAAIGDLAAAGSSQHAITPVEAIFYVIGTMLLLDRAGFFEGSIVATPPVLGGGATPTDYGEIPGPAPATLDILARHRFPFASAPVDVELTTPTGAALLANLAERAVNPYPAMVPVRVGYGTGTRGIPGRPDLLRVVEGESLPPGEDRMVILETNLDDIPGEVIGYTIERLFAEGAVDVFVTPALGKKNRPVNVVSVMVAAGAEDHLVRVLMEETGTLGVRVHEFRKVVAVRKKETVPVSLGGRVYPVRVKTSTMNGDLIAEKPEYDDISAIAREQGISFRFVDEEVRLRISEWKRARTDAQEGAGGGCPPDRPNAVNPARDE